MTGAPELARRLVLEAAARTPDGAGGAALAWTALGTLWGAVAPLPPVGAGAEGTRDRRVRVTLRGAPEGSPRRPAPGQRLREGARAWIIEAVEEADPLGRHLVALAREEARP